MTFTDGYYGAWNYLPPPSKGKKYNVKNKLVRWYVEKMKDRFIAQADWDGYGVDFLEEQTIITPPYYPSLPDGWIVSWKAHCKFKKRK